MSRIYVAGPMTGYQDLNFPAFMAEAARLRDAGHEVVNPAEISLPAGTSWEDYMRADIPQMLTCDTICLLPGWDASRGARLECHIARILGFQVMVAGARPVDQRATDAGTAARATFDPVVEANRALLRRRSQAGIRKYGVTLGEAKLSERELVTHALEEALDLANYLQALLHAGPTVSAPA